jgi:hypothetical protein
MAESNMLDTRAREREARLRKRLTDAGISSEEIQRRIDQSRASKIATAAELTESPGLSPFAKLEARRQAARLDKIRGQALAAGMSSEEVERRLAQSRHSTVEYLSQLHPSLESARPLREQVLDHLSGAQTFSLLELCGLTRAAPHDVHAVLQDLLERDVVTNFRVELVTPTDGYVNQHRTMYAGTAFS